MTDLITRGPNDTGDIPLGIGEQRTVILRTTPGETTQNLAGWDADLPPFRRPEHDETREMHLIAAPYGLSHPRDLAGPQNPPPPLPPTPPAPTKYDMAAAQPLWPLERVAGADDTAVHTILGSLTATIDGELAQAAPPLRRSVPYAIPADARPWSGPRHAAPAPVWTRWAIGVGVLLAIWSAATLAVIL